MALKYWRFGAVALIAVLILFTAGVGALLAAEIQGDDTIADGIVTVQWIDSDHGPMAGAVIRILFYREGDPIPGIVPGSWVMDADGMAVVTGVPRPAEGAAPVLLDVRGDLGTSTVDEDGCTVFEDWVGLLAGVTSDVAVAVDLETVSSTSSVNCPEPTPTPAVDPTPTPTPAVTPTPTPTPGNVDPTPTPTPTPSGSVLGATGQPQITPPATDTNVRPVAPGGSPFVPALLALLAIAAVVVPAATRAAVRATTARRGRR